MMKLEVVIVHCPSRDILMVEAAVQGELFPISLTEGHGQSASPSNRGHVSSLTIPKEKRGRLGKASTKAPSLRQHATDYWLHVVLLNIVSAASPR